MQKINVENNQMLAENVQRQPISPATGDRRLGVRVMAATKGRARRSLAWVRRSSAREFWEWARCKRVTYPSVQQLSESMAALRPAASDGVTGGKQNDAPIFLLATGWRAGSTLLQRILVTDPNVLLWGEPFGDLALPSRIAEMVSHISELYLLKERFIQDNLASTAMATSWIASLYPPGDDFRLALRGLFDRWLGEPARQRGFARWGLKEVRLGAAEASLLHWLYPFAKFVIYRAILTIAIDRWPTRVGITFTISVLTCVSIRLQDSPDTGTGWQPAGLNCPQCSLASTSSMKIWLSVGSTSANLSLGWAFRSEKVSRSLSSSGKPLCVSGLAGTSV